MKNIVIFGPGNKPNRFAYDFAENMRAEGNRVTKFSHTNHNTGHPDDYTINYNQFKECEEVFNQFLLDNTDPIDTIIFHQAGGSYPNFPLEGYKKPDEILYRITLNTHVIIPHLFLTSVLDRLTPNAKVIFFCNSSGFLLDLDYRMNTKGHAGYVGANMWKINMMYALASTRTEKQIYTCLSLSINYSTKEGLERYKTKDYHDLSDWILNMPDEHNGKMVVCWGHENLKVFESNFLLK